MSDEQDTIEVPRETLAEIDQLLETLCKNAGRCFGIDFAALNRSMIFTSKALKK